MLLAVASTVAWLLAQAAPPPPAPAKDEPPATPGKPTPRPTPTPPPLLEGVVKGPDGKPVKDARILARVVAARYDQPPLTARTDEEGRFRFQPGSSGPFSVRVDAAGLAGQTLEKVRPGSRLLISLGRGRTIEGLVRDTAGQAVAGARVVAWADSAFPASAWDLEGRLQATTDARGRYRIEGVGLGLHSVTATARGFGSARKGGVRPGATADLVLGRGGGVAGLVLDPEGRPLAGALVRVEPETRYSGETQTDHVRAEGRFEVAGLPPGPYTVVVRHPDLAPAS
jgi:hypothetical protein